ncbi:amino acid-binding protein [Cronobacter muytjensii]|uniref:amino acid-binding protein n=1 Tax=Cronobacter muytjensii TaxID=413501 RepID=UPI00039F79E1|nr:amino acid-binding protein [Cronobacter muytjensii]ALB72720.1 amino acid-binding protein [Cronobacter muytjensii ATCC 51329]
MNSNATRWLAGMIALALSQAVSAHGIDRDLAAPVQKLTPHGANAVPGPLNWDEKSDLKGFEAGVFTWHADGASTVAKNGPSVAVK